MTPELKARWVADLRDPNNKQGHNVLRKIDGPDDKPEYSYCCLGRLCIVAGAHFNEYSEEVDTDDGLDYRDYDNRPVRNGVNLADGDEENLSPAFMREIDLKPAQADTLIAMNDGSVNPDGTKNPPKDFPFIATWIEENL